MTAPAVSIVVPVFNGCRFLPRAIESLLHQTLDDWEIVVVDDGSTDDTPSVIERYRARLGERMRCLRQENAGASAARNRGIEHGTGRFVAFLDADDEYLPHKLARQLTLFERAPELGFVYGDYAYLDETGVRHESVFDELCPLAREVPADPLGERLRAVRGDLFDVLLRGYFIATIVGMVRREVLGDDIRFDESLHYAEEWLFYLRVARACRAGFVDEPLCLHHRVPGSVTRTNSTMNNRGYRDTLRAILGAFPDLRADQRRGVQRMLADASRQCGYDALRADDARAALSDFTNALIHRPGPRAAVDLMRAVVHSARRVGVQGR
jgi:glycosyltransferase involved in cell wall biosynthesis